jgi:glycosyltransferase involved in cell wall biosynthesis
MKKITIRSETMLGTSHSWAVTMRGLLSGFKNNGHSLFIKSINGRELIPPDLLEDIEKWHPMPDLDISYTIPVNFKNRFLKSSKCKAAIYNYESSTMPIEWSLFSDSIDFIFPSSEWSRQIFLENGFKENKCITISHGVDEKIINSKNKYKLKSTSSFKFLNVSIPHYRKNINLVLEAYYSSFRPDDDVTLVIKTSLNKPKYKFECNFLDQLLLAQKKFGPNLPRVEVVVDTIDNMGDLYNSCDSVISASSSEGFGLPLLEGLLMNKIVIAPNCTGQLDFLNNHNSLLVDTKMIEADERYQYWKFHKNVKINMPKVDHLSEQMLFAYKNKDILTNKLFLNNQSIKEKFNWNKISNNIISLIK